MKKKIVLIIGMLILVNLGIVTALQVFTYKIDSTGMQVVSFESDIFDSAFRYNELTLDSCVNGFFSGDGDQEISISMDIFEVDCGTYSLYNMIKFIRDNYGEMDVVLGEGLDAYEILVAEELARFYGITNIRNAGDLIGDSSLMDRNMIVVGNSDANVITEELIGDWTYGIGESVIVLIADNEKIKVVVAGTSQVETVRAMQSLQDYTTSFESFNSDCVIFTGCEKSMPADIDNNLIVDLSELLIFINKWQNLEVDFEQVLETIDWWKIS